MPNLTLQYSGNLDIDTQDLLLELHGVLFDSELFEYKHDIKSRAIQFDEFLIGDGLEKNAFIHLQVCVLNGRTTEQLQQLNEQLLQKIKDNQKLIHTDVTKEIHLSVEVVEMNKEIYRKAVISRVET
ncbi:5-carboxymethyl-2-hydroxymuconate Delta-isomerase [Acinetobacter pollinis]|jgi:5-carboxymethyl-2-hydroxymuconate isomerase|uniref:5-carboxymethyl-2-hydroxymuconate Delta-isomerase n=1 Tax=Acinetobacter pollinis TaxID=2605270 RepID=UPI0018A2F239|nr:5-carboxymethyl-2-hydroxymuconate isomerase [Acinetobacter pollinis]MBF7689414.1 5-carboxymethyl-2-hydroxymuconate isomerase [Acinetobacter pollinis]MBF7692061.1 5-carboxymethyl-2-hydroxymuconate isomerase [Acinetobacter pollinis]MBF7696991.1 5-carboxymethyl-2-hydroxymuconate isomerase [Acinetobacter pollinis]MBF7700382.1 5-carboxymethyl-2-hydroxymuconate isomerase [Acinetobacter pollinis]